MMKVKTDNLKWISTDITIGSGSAFHIHSIVSYPTAATINFYFAGKT